MDGSPQRGSLHATTLWHSDAAEWAPSTASITDIEASAGNVRFTPKSGHWLSVSGWDIAPLIRSLRRRGLAAAPAPSDRACLRLTISSYLVGACTGMSA